MGKRECSQILGSDNKTTLIALHRKWKPMEKLKEVIGTVCQANGKMVTVLGNDGNMYYIEFDKKHLSRYKDTEIEAGQIITLLIKNQAMSHEVVDIVNRYEHFEQKELVAV